jgi:hypothetical protein
MSRSTAILRIQRSLLIDIVLLEPVPSCKLRVSSKESQESLAAATKASSHDVKNLWNMENPVENGQEESRLTTG